MTVPAFVIPENTIPTEVGLFYQDEDPIMLRLGDVGLNPCEIAGVEGMLSFYGGPAGKDFTIAKIFDSKASLDADIAAGDASEIYVGDYVLVR